MQLKPQHVGVVLGTLLGGMHAAWSLLVALGLAKPLLDFILGVHFLKIPHEIAPFDFGTAALLVIITSLIGYVVGYLGAALWNKVAK